MAPPGSAWPCCVTRVHPGCPDTHCPCSFSVCATPGAPPSSAPRKPCLRAGRFVRNSLPSFGVFRTNYPVCTRVSPLEQHPLSALSPRTHHCLRAQFPSFSALRPEWAQFCQQCQLPCLPVPSTSCMKTLLTNPLSSSLRSWFTFASQEATHCPL